MRKHVCFACGKIIFINIMFSLIFSLVFGLTFGPLGFLVTGILMQAISFFVFRNAYTLVYMDEKGIRNRYYTVKWEDISCYHYFNTQQETTEMSQGRPRTAIRITIIKIPDIIGIGKINGKRFLKESPQNAVFFSVTKRNMSAIRTLCQEKNDTINDILSWEFYSKLL